MKLRALILSALSATLALAPALVTPVSAYTLNYCGSTPLKWASNSFTTSASSVGFPVGTWRDALSETLSRWNQNPSKAYVSTTFDDPGIGLGNGQSEVWWESSASSGNHLSGSPAITYTWWNGSCQLTEADVIFNNQTAYTTSHTTSSLNSYGGSYRPFQTTATHEYGHAQGLAHTNWTYNIMGDDWNHISTNGGSSYAYPGEDASNGLAALYGVVSSGYQDIGAVHWKYLGTSGQYSTHQLTKMYTTGGSVLGTTYDSSTKESRFNVTHGGTYQVEFTYENNGRDYQTTTAYFYVSTNNWITTADTSLGGINLNLARDLVYTRKDTITIPANLAPGKYWIGVIVDKDGLIGETNETNNATYLPIQVF